MFRCISTCYTRLHILWAFRPQTEGFRPEGREVFIMIIYVDASVIQTGNGTKENPFKTIQEAAAKALPGDEVIVAPGLYREAVNPIHIGKYGRMWIEFMKTEHSDRYRNLVRFGRLWDKATEIDEEAYELLETIESKWLSSHKPKNRQSFWEMYQLRTQARMMAEEAVLYQVIRQYH